MFKKYFYFIRRSDWLLSFLAIFLTVVGLIVIYSIEASPKDSQFLNFKKQLVFLGIGILLMIFFSLLDYRYLRVYAYVLFGLGILILGAVFVLGVTIRGTRGWIQIIGSQGFQPVELVKIILIIVLARKFSEWRSNISSLRELGVIFLFAAPLVILVFLQPDFGSALILSVIFLGMVLLTRIKKSYLVFIAVIISVLFIASWFFVLKGYQKDRILTFINPDRDPWGSGYNIKQSIIAVGSGNVFGRGLVLGPQSRLNFLPVQETDFIFAVLAEELGFVGSFLLLAIFMAFLYRMFKIIRQIRDDFGIFFVSGIIIYIFFQSLLNIGMNIGLMPITGVPLPFVSYGGSSLLASFIAVGIIQSIYIRHRILIPGK